MLTNQQTVERYNLTLEEWKALSPGQKSTKRASLWRKERTLCECGNLATIIQCGERICERCSNIQSNRTYNTNQGAQGEIVGHPGVTAEYTFQSHKTLNKISTY